MLKLYSKYQRWAVLYGITQYIICGATSLAVNWFEGTHLRSFTVGNKFSFIKYSTHSYPDILNQQCCLCFLKPIFIPRRLICNTPVMPAATMELRKHIKAPKRYSRELEEDSPPVSPTDVRQQSKPSRIKAKIVKYNPDLPPVAFPTLDPRTTLACDNSRSGKHGVPVRLASARKHIKDRGSLSVSSTEREVTASALKHLQHPREMSASQAKQYSNDNGPGNPIWEKNMKLMDEWDARNEEDWFVKGCETSDEEGIPGLSVSSVCLPALLAILLCTDNHSGSSLGCYTPCSSNRNGICRNWQ